MGKERREFDDKAPRAVSAVRRSLRAYAGIVRAVAADLKRLEAGLPLPPQRVLDRLWDEGYDSQLYPAVETHDAAEAVQRELCRAAWLLERGSVGRRDLEEEEEDVRPDPAVAGYPPEPLPPDPDPVAAARRELLGGAVVLRALGSALRDRARLLARRARRQSLSAQARRSAATWAGNLASLSDDVLAAALGRLDALATEGSRRVARN